VKVIIIYRTLLISILTSLTLTTGQKMSKVNLYGLSEGNLSIVEHWNLDYVALLKQINFMHRLMSADQYPKEPHLPKA
jgi:hypothetical protein